MLLTSPCFFTPEVFLFSILYKHVYIAVFRSFKSCKLVRDVCSKTLRINQEAFDSCTLPDQCKIATSVTIYRKVGETRAKSNKDDPTNYLPLYWY